MTELEYQLSFTTPAFLGNAKQSGQWRTPPFKALLRQWWRVAYAESRNFEVNVAQMREVEGLLFGNAWLKEEFCKSRVLLRLSCWEIRNPSNWVGLEQGTVQHPEVEHTGFKVGPHAYLGFGPLDGRSGTKLSAKANSAIQAGEQATFSIAAPTAEADLIKRTLALMHCYGATGGRSRNGWGSFALEPKGNTQTLGESAPLRPWKDALRLDWPHALGSDEKGALTWQTSPVADWKTVMSQLAIIKIGLRTQFKFTTGDNTRTVEPRHWLSHPVTKHNVSAWNKARLPNSLRFKVRHAPNNQVVGVIFHVPCFPPPAFKPDLAAIIDTWKSVHALLDQLTLPVNQRTYASVTDSERRDQLRATLNAVTLKRTPV
jgi:CRISPR-associated protein Cmr1